MTIDDDKPAGTGAPQLQRDCEPDDTGSENRHGRSSLLDHWPVPGVPPQIERMHIPERVALIGESVKDADARLSSRASAPDVLDTTHFDTVRFPPPPWALREFARAADDGSLAYTPHRGNRDVREKVAGSLTRFLGVSIDPETQVVLTPGTQAGLFASLAALTGPGTRVLLVDPDYIDMERTLHFLGADIIPIPLAGTASGPQPDLEMMERALRAGPAVVVFSHPNNPTGAVYSADTIRRLAELVEQSESLVIVDELYARLTYDSSITHLAAQRGMASRCVTLLGPSKTESMSGYRIGVVAGPAELMDRVEDVVSITSLRAPSYAQHVLTHWLVDDEAWLSERLVQFRRLRDSTIARLSELDWLHIDPPPGAAYLFPDVSALRSRDQLIAEQLLSEARILVNPGYQFGRRGIGHFRLCYARDEHQWDAALTRMVQVLDSLARGIQ